MTEVSWKNRIVTLLIDGDKRRGDIHKALSPVYDAGVEATIDTTLYRLVEKGDVVKPRRGWYALPPKKEPA